MGLGRAQYGPAAGKSSHKPGYCYTRTRSGEAHHVVLFVYCDTGNLYVLNHARMFD